MRTGATFDMRVEPDLERLALPQITDRASWTTLLAVRAASFIMDIVWTER